jgi:hypothetical protein
MSLLDIKKKLYKKETEENLSQHAESEFDARSSLADPKQGKFSGDDAWEDKRSELNRDQKKAIGFGIMATIGIAIIAASLIGIYRFQQSAFGEERVSITISGPKEVRSGDPMTFEVSYKNANRISLKNAALRLNFPENFKFEDNPSFISESPSNGRFDLGEIKRYSDGKVTFRGQAFSPTGSLIYVKAELAYEPSNFNSQFVSKHQLGVNITSFPIILEVLAPLDLASGDSLDYLISYKNTSEEDFDNIKLKIEYPEGFTFSRANPAASEGNNTWYIGHVSKQQEGKIIISGKLEGSRDEIRVVRANIGSSEGEFVSYNQESASTKIAASPLFIAQSVNGLTSLTANAGDILRFEIAYKNEGNIGLKDVIINEKIDSPVLNYTTLLLYDKGAYNPSSKTITWKASDFKNLAKLEPGEEGKISFTINVKDVIPVGNVNDKNFIISSVAKIDSPDIPTPIESNKIIAGNTIDIKLNSKLGLVVKGFYNDAMIKNSGPLPPTVGQETTYTMHWSVFNVSNDLADAKVETMLPTGVVFTGAKQPTDANLAYNERTNALIWQIGNLFAGTGVLVPAKELAFQVKIKPAPSQIGNPVDLTGVSIFSGRDLFTNENLSISVEKKSTLLREDPLIGENYKVQLISP